VARASSAVPPIHRVAPISPGAQLPVSLVDEPAAVFGQVAAEPAVGHGPQCEPDLEELADRLERGDAALLDEADEAAGSFAGEQLRALLLRAAAEGEVTRLQELPWGVGATFRQGRGVPSRGAPGTFFACRTRPLPVQRYWRYVRDDEIDREELPILRVINPGQAAGVQLPDDVETAWRIAVADVVAQHNLRSDPAAQDNRLPASQRWALTVLRDPTVALPPGADEADELLAVPRDASVRSALTELQRNVSERLLSRDQAAVGVIAVVREFGLTPVPPPPVLTPVTEDDVGVVCWMRVRPAD
jgi:hypothetical protein